MTIAGHCIELLRSNGPMTAEELGEACRLAGVTKAANPASSVTSALTSYGRGSAIRLDGRLHLVAALLDGRWLTFERPREPLAFTPGLDLHPLSRTAAHQTIPVTGGGELGASRWGAWSVSGCALPDSEVLGLRLTGRSVEIAAITLDGAAFERGERLADRVHAEIGPPAYWSTHAEKVTDGLLHLLHADAGLLRDPVPPLSLLLPEPEKPEHDGPSVPAGHRLLEVTVPVGVYARLADAADEHGLPVGGWVGAELARLSSWPVTPVGLPRASGDGADRTYDGGTYDGGRYDGGMYDGGMYDGGIYNDGMYDDEGYGRVVPLWDR